MICYTAIFGDYDSVIEQPSLEEVRYILFTDNQSIMSETWEIRGVPKGFLSQLNSRMRAKWYKTHPHLLFPNQNTCYIDGNMKLYSNYFELFNYVGDNGFALYTHPEGRDCIYQEAYYCKDFPKYKNQPIMEQVNYYRGEGFPEHYGLWACGNLFRRDTKVVRNMDKAWWEENIRWSYQDQISFPYVLWKYGWKVDTIQKNQYSGKHFKILGHNRDD